ncbi:ABC transporter ATP-binding protein [Micromonospora sp. ATCC 39149]|uniref:ABC transporter ATP-binding protein n=1 Tax=Micromonospora carbonacea TaxID=47853 RepID=A0A7D5YE02_9ACTN|nr:ABC transporter ATP-binding protein [Micromonospora sp. ATCC 39149]QLJ97715.1 ABC transporter ATP-binding protein [Micromonospora carbonacea]
MPQQEHRSWRFRLARYCLRHRRPLAALLVGVILAQVVAVATPLVLRTAVDDLFAGIDSPGVGWWAGLLVAFALLRYAITLVSTYCAGRIALDVTHELRTDAFDALAALDGPGQDRLNTGQVVSRTVADLALVQGAIAALPVLVGDGLLFLLVFAAMAVLSPWLTLFAVAMVPALWLMAHRAPGRLFPVASAAQQRAAEITGRVEAAVSGVVIVKGFAQEARELAELEEQCRELYSARMAVARLQSRYASALQAVPLLWQGALLLLGGFLVMSGRLSIGTFLAFCVYLNQVVSPLRGLTPLLTVAQQARAATERVFAVIDVAPETGDPDESVPLPPGPLSVEFRDVWFGYGDDPPVLRGLSLRVEAGETVAVVGAAGSGKSTLLGLLARFYRPAAGAVLVGGVDLSRVRSARLRSRLGLVFEDDFLFDDTVFANIAFGLPGAGMQQVQAAADAAAAGFVAGLPKGYDTPVGERGGRLSGGQRQRVAIARAILPGPSLLILDDAMSALDVATEQRVRAGLRRASRTTILIARRRATLEMADRVVVLDEGRVVDCGPLAEVESRCAAFRSVFAADDSRAPGPQESGEGTRSEIADRYAATVDTSFAHDTPSLTLTDLVRPVRLLLAVAFVLILLDIGARTAIPALVREGVDQGMLAGSRPALLAVALLVLVVAGVNWAAARGGATAAASAGERLLLLLRVRAFAHLQRLGLDFYDREPTGQLLTRMTTDVDALADFLRAGVPVALVSTAMLVTVLGALLTIDAGLALVPVVALLAAALATWLFRAIAMPAYGEARRQVGALNATLHEVIAGLRVAQAFGRVGDLRDRYVTASRGYRDSRLRAHLLVSVYLQFTGLLSDLARVAVLVVGAARLASGDLSAGVLVAFFLYIDLVFAPIQDLSQVLDRYRQAAVGFAQLRALLRAPVRPPRAPGALPPRRPAAEIRLCGVGFTYPGADRPALADVELALRVNETVALVGRTGSGKSSLVKLIARFYDPTVGAVLVDGVDLRQLDLAGHRRRLGIVAQDPYLSAGTVRDAIAYGRPAASEAEVEAAARRVAAHAVIASLPGGYAHPTGTRGQALSAGQRQLLALARAELVQPDVLLLDEATAALDPAAEAAVLDAMARLGRGRITVVIAHRLATAARADRIVVLDAGRVVETGRHDDLLAADGHYARLWAAQAATGQFADIDPIETDLLESAWPTQRS